MMSAASKRRCHGGESTGGDPGDDFAVKGDCLVVLLGGIVVLVYKKWR